MEHIQSHFTFTKGQRSGILFLVLVIIGLLLMYNYYPPKKESLLDTSSEYIIALRNEIDSLHASEVNARAPKIYPFNPNFISDYKAYSLGIPSEAFDKLKRYRSKNKWINSTADFKRVTQISDSLLECIGPFFKFPEWVRHPKPRKQARMFDTTVKSYLEKKDLNLASKEELMTVYGVGEVLSSRIISYREKLEGFSADIQIASVYGLNSEAVSKILNHFTVKTPKRIEKINLNTASASDIATIPGVSFHLAKEIWETRVLREQISSFQELEKIQGLSKVKLQLIQLYLSLE